VPKYFAQPGKNLLDASTEPGHMRGASRGTARQALPRDLTRTCALKDAQAPLSRERRSPLKKWAARQKLVAPLAAIQ